ncbi:MAG: hypothetical protein WKF84_14495 [Pyrinomonadaceae bacterium]
MMCVSSVPGRRVSPLRCGATNWELDTLVLEASDEAGGQMLRVYNPINNHLGVRARDGREMRDIFTAQTDTAEFDLWTNVETESIELGPRKIQLSQRRVAPSY